MYTIRTSSSQTSLFDAHVCESEQSKQRRLELCRWISMRECLNMKGNPEWIMHNHIPSPKEVHVVKNAMGKQNDISSGIT